MAGSLPRKISNAIERNATINPAFEADPKVSAGALVIGQGRCFRAVDAISEEEAKLVTIDEETNDQIVHRGRFRKANRATDEPFDPRPQVDVLTLDSLGILLADFMLLGGNMALVCPPSIGVKPRDPKRLQETLKFKKNRILSTPKDIR